VSFERQRSHTLRELARAALRSQTFCCKCEVNAAERLVYSAVLRYLAGMNTRGGGLRVVAALLMGWVSACDNGAVEKCESLAELLCTRVLECANLATEPAIQECTDKSADEAECDLAFRVIDAYDACVDAINNASCETLAKQSSLSRFSASSGLSVCNLVGYKRVKPKH